MTSSPRPSARRAPRAAVATALLATAVALPATPAGADVGVSAILAPADIPGLTGQETHGALSLERFEALANRGDAATRRADTARLRAAGYVSGAYGLFTSSSLGLVGSALVEVRPAAAASVARWEATSAHSDGITFTRRRLRGFANGWLITARRVGDGRVVGHAVLFTRGRFVSQTLVGNPERVLKPVVAIRLARIARSRIPS